MPPLLYKRVHIDVAPAVLTPFYPHRYTLPDLFSARNPAVSVRYCSTSFVSVLISRYALLASKQLLSG